MKNKIFITLIFLILSLNSNSQTVETITEEISLQICDCIGNIASYSDLKPKLDSCYDIALNDIFKNASKDEITILGDIDKLNAIKTDIEPYIKTKCDRIKSLIETELANSIETSSQENISACPVNFDAKTLENARKNIDEWNGKIVSFDSEVVKVKTGYRGKPYYKVKFENGSHIWIASLVTSGYEIVGKKLRILGYFSNVENDKIAEKYNKTGYHILAFSIIDLETKQMSMLPGSEKQIQMWINGKIPTDK